MHPFIRKLPENNRKRNYKIYLHISSIQTKTQLSIFSLLRKENPRYMIYGVLNEEL